MVSLFLFAAAIALSPVHFECGAKDGHIVPPRNRLVPILASEFQSDYASLHRMRFGPFGAPYDIERLDVFSSLNVVFDPDDERAPGGGRLQLAVAVRRRGVSRYFRLVDEDGDDIGMEEQGEHEREGPPLDIRFGTPDASLPIIRVAVTSTWKGVHGGGATAFVSYLDFGFSAPRVIAETQCESGWMGGACTAYDDTYSRRGQLTCDWDRAARDYQCELRHVLNLEWTSRNEIARAALFAGREKSVPPMTRKAAGLLAGRWQILVAAPHGYEEKPQIFALDEKEEIAVPVTVLHDQNNERTPMPDYPMVEPLHLTQTDDSFSVASHPVLHEGTFAVIAVVFAEHEHRTLLWIGGDSATGKVDALRIATDGPEYVQCNMFLVPESASSLEVEQPFRATLRMEPSWFALGDDSHYEDQHLCPRDVHVVWSDGFVADWDGSGCEEAPPAQHVTVSPNGELSAAAP